MNKFLIAHRGNTNGRLESHENEPTYIDLTIKLGYDVETDVWYKNSILWLGHDNPQYEVNFRWLRDRITKLWIHCKDIKTIEFISNLGYNFNYFYHTDEDVVLTSKGYLWVYPGKQPIKNSISVLPELHNDDYSECIGICSDEIEKYKIKNE